MRLLTQLLIEAGADTVGAFTVVPGFGGYFKNVKRVEDYSPERIILTVLKKRLQITGENLVIEKYFQQDLSVRGNVTGVNFE